MAVSRPPTNLTAVQLYCFSTEQHHLSTPSKVLCNPLNPSHFFRASTARRPSISFNSTFQNCNSSKFEDTHLRKSVIESGFSKNQSVTDLSWVNGIIREYTEDGLFDDAIKVYLEMMNYGLPVEEFYSFPCLIKAFGGLSDVEKGRQIHGHVLKLGGLIDIYVVNSLLAMYWKCGAFEDAMCLFEKMHERDYVSWNTMISGFDQSSQYARSLMMFSRMIQEFGLYPNRVACLSALSSCASCLSLIHGKEIHTFVIKSGLQVDAFLANVLIDMYMKCGDPRDAKLVFKSILKRELLRGNTVIWNVMISGYVCNGCLLEALMMFHEMMVLGIEPDSSTMVAVLVLCSQLLDLEVGRQIHGYIFSFGQESDARVETALLDMYSKCGDIEAGLKVFERSSNRNFIMWGAVLAGCAQSGHPTKVLELFANFRLEGGIADSVVVLAVLRACSSLTLKLKGMEIHGLTVKMGFDCGVFVGGALIDLYAKCRDIESARKIFLRLSARDLVTWNALICGYAQNNYAEEALKAFRDMQFEQVRPNTVTAACILSVCAHLSVMISCKEIHGYLIRNWSEPNVLVNNSLIAAYARCGDINRSCSVFENMLEKNIVSWNSMILGFGMHGCMVEMFALFDKMIAEAMRPDHITFTAILSGCSHAGRVDEGWKHFRSMVEDYELEPELEHYTCMVDLLGRAGHLDQAYDLIMDMPCVPDARIWGSLLGSCRNHSDEWLTERVAKHVFGLDPTSVGYRVLLANIYEGFGKWNEVTRIRADMKDLGLKKRPGCSWIEVNNKVHIFIAGDQSHHQSKEIYATIGNLTVEIKGAGYTPQLLSKSIGNDEASEEGFI
ncbi:hypothetical protein HHK36_015587 [Tetracentron sinense]|uniref:Chlororespiratory reduction 21 n=1 Tax=Tetracentron sinense TaxID=13715 RepID=A0A834Z5D9_TETSI|nr:hypothetical protein HHK36_015587 [Tetracentron sinense]